MEKFLKMKVMDGKFFANEMNFKKEYEKKLPKRKCFIKFKF